MKHRLNNSYVKLYFLALSEKKESFLTNTPQIPKLVLNMAFPQV